MPRLSLPGLLALVPTALVRPAVVKKRTIGSLPSIVDTSRG